jgi:DNA-binding NarL/FixJ family response regulator
LHREYPSLPILILSMHDEPATVRRALQAGATGYLTKESSPDTLHAAVRQVAAGERFIPPGLAETLAFESVRPSGLPHETLSQRERQIFKLIAQGVSLNLIAEQLHLSPKTVTTHKTHLMEKLGTGNNADLIRYAIEHKLFD